MYKVEACCFIYATEKLLEKKSFTEDMKKNKSPRLEAGKVFSTKSDTLCLTPNSHMIEEEIQYSYVVLSPPCASYGKGTSLSHYIYIHIHTYIHTYIYTYIHNYILTYILAYIHMILKFKIKVSKNA